MLLTRLMDNGEYTAKEVREVRHIIAEERNSERNKLIK
jgi:hypothetical protein